MSRRALLCSLVLAGTACIPKQRDDMDGDGILDAVDRCMTEPEDMDRFEDTDGCPEEGTRESPGDFQEDDQDTPATPDVETRSLKMKLSKAKPLKTAKASANVRPFRKSAWGADIDQDERGWVIFGFGRAWLGAGTGKAKQLKGDVYSASFSPEGSHVGLVTAKGFVVAELASGKVVKRYAYAKGTEDSPETKAIRLQARGALLYFDGCTLHRGTLESAKSKALSERMCGRPLVSDDGERWMVQPETEDNVQVFALSLTGGAPTLVLGGASERGLAQLLLSPDGHYLCYSRSRDGSALTCRDNEKNEDRLIWKGPTDTRAAFSADGKLAFSDGPLRSERRLLLADLKARTMRVLGSLGPKEEWLRAVGQRSFVASGGEQLLLFDLDAQQQVTIPLKAGEWEGFTSIPGRDREFVLGKERKSTRDLFRVTVQ